MASPVNNNSSSSPPIPNRPNPKPRNSEAGDPLRRSFKDFSRRNSFGGDKENETKAFPIPKGSKNFMLPTISAVSKINASPRKRVLSDKNEMSRSFSDVKGLVLDDNKSHHRAKSCVSFSDVLQIIGNDKDEQMFGGKMQFEESYGMTVTGDDNDDQIFGISGKKQFEESHDMTVTDFDEKEVLENKGIAYSDPRFRISPRPCAQYTSPEFAGSEVDSKIPRPCAQYTSPEFAGSEVDSKIPRPCAQYTSPEFAGSEVDSKIPPYDPKKNYLSPRPQFLHYKPNPRIENHFDECKQLEELFISESSSSDTELSVEESTGLSVEESENSEEQQKSGAEEVVEEAEDVEQLEAESDEEIVFDSIEETSQVPKQSGFRTFKFLGLFLTLAMTYLLVSATFSTPTESPFHKFHIPNEFTEFSKANNLEQLSEKLWALTESSLVYIDKLISGLGGGEKGYGSLQFYNLTYILKDDTVFQPTSVEISEEPIQENYLGDVYGEDGDVNEFEEGSLAEEVVSETEDGVADTNEFDEQTEMKPDTDTEVNEDEGNLNALFEDGVESEVSLEENDDAGGSDLQGRLETTSFNKDQEETETIYIGQHNVESAAVIVHLQKESEIADAESGSEEGFEENAAETDLHLEVRSSNTADHDLPKTDIESVSEEAFEEIAGETSDELHLEVRRSSSKAGSDFAKTEAESVSEEAFGELAGETSDDLHPKAWFYNEAILVLSSTVLVLLAGVAFLFGKTAKIVAASAPEPALETTEKLSTSHVPENLMKEKFSSLNFEAEVDDRMSNSFQKKSSFNKDPQSKGDSKMTNNSSSKLRRESMASSASEYSIGSFSYGSFTTYEKIPIKSGDREEEMITPVRRSSRIRKNQPSGPR